jgi:hypothetical protein
MGEVVNLRRARKIRDRREGEETARENRAAFGRTKAERELSEATARLTRERLEAHRLEGVEAADESA